MEEERGKEAMWQSRRDIVWTAAVAVCEGGRRKQHCCQL